jgi:flagellar hook protein FlgE
VSWSISSSGVVNAVDSAGNTTALGTIALATFPNPGGLAKVGDTQYQATPNSGAAAIGAPSSGARGSITSGYLEMSNVDLASELTNLIIAERGFQANSRVITTSDDVLQTLVSLKQ